MDKAHLPTAHWHGESRLILRRSPDRSFFWFGGQEWVPFPGEGPAGVAQKPWREGGHRWEHHDHLIEVIGGRTKIGNEAPADVAILRDELVVVNGRGLAAGVGAETVRSLDRDVNGGRVGVDQGQSAG